MTEARASSQTAPRIHIPTPRERLKWFIHDWVVVPLKIIVRNKKALFGFIVTLFFIGLAIFGPMVLPPPKTFVCPSEAPPSWQHPLGCDYYGADIWTEIVYGTRTVLEIAFIAGVITTLVGIAVGMIAGFKGGKVDAVLMGITDVLMTIPGLPLLIVLSFILRNLVANPVLAPFVVGAILSVNAWTGLARSIRSQVLALKQREFVEAARALGMSTSYIVFVEIMPNLMSFIAVNFIFSTIGAIYSSIALYYLAVLPFTAYNWGIMLYMAWNNMDWQTLDAVVGFIILLQLGLFMFSYAVDEMFNPRLRTEI